MSNNNRRNNFPTVGVEEGVDTVHVHTRNKTISEERNLSKKNINKKIRRVIAIQERKQGN